MDTIGKLTELFRQFPGIGPRQARRFAYFVSTKNTSFISELKDAIELARQNVHTCKNCFKIYFDKDGKSCSICNDKNRNSTLRMIVARDIDLESMEKSGAYNGLYIVLGGLVPIMSDKPETHIRLKELINLFENADGEVLKEIIIGLNTTPEGENTSQIIKDKIGTLASKKNIKISNLGRGLSTGAEIEYADAHTIKDALLNRH